MTICSPMLLDPKGGFPKRLGAVLQQVYCSGTSVVASNMAPERELDFFGELGSLFNQRSLWNYSLTHCQMCS